MKSEETMKKISTVLATSRRTRRFIRSAELKQRTGLSKTTIWRKTREGTFPKPISLSSGAVGWLEDEVEGWIDDRIADRNGARVIKVHSNPTEKTVKQ